MICPWFPLKISCITQILMIQIKIHWMEKYWEHKGSQGSSQKAIMKWRPSFVLKRTPWRWNHKSHERLSRAAHPCSCSFRAHRRTSCGFVEHQECLGSCYCRQQPTQSPIAVHLLPPHPSGCHPNPKRRPWCPDAGLYFAQEGLGTPHPLPSIAWAPQCQSLVWHPQSTLGAQMSSPPSRPFREHIDN